MSPAPLSGNMPPMTVPRPWYTYPPLVHSYGLCFVAGCGPSGSTSPSNSTKYENPAPGNSSASSAPASPPSVVANSFEEVTARLDRGGGFYMHLSVAQWLEGLSGRIADLRAGFPTKDMTPEDVQKMDKLFNLGTSLVKRSGIEQLTGIGSSSLAVDKGVQRNTFFAHHYKGKETGLLGTLFGTSPHALNTLNLLPAETAVASSGDYDLAGLVHAILQTIDESGTPELKQQVAQGLQQFQAATGMSLDEFLASLGSEIDVVLTLDPAKKITVPLGDADTMVIPAPRLALLIEVKDDKLFNKVDQTLAQMPSIIKTDEPNLKMRTMAYPVMPDFELRGTVARWDKFLVLASDDHLLRDMIATQKGGAGFKASPLYAKLSSGMPAEGNGFNLTTKAFLELVRNYQKQAMAKQGDAMPAQLAWLQKMMLSQTPKDTYSVSAHVENGWLTVSKNAQ